MKVEEISREQWCQALDSLPAFPFFATPRYIDAWIKHHASDARSIALRVVASSGAWRLVATASIPTSRFGTEARLAAPEGGYAVAGIGEMPAGWRELLLREMRRIRTDSVELTIGPDEPIAAPLQGDYNVSWSDAWVVDLRPDGAAWSPQQLDKRTRRQLRTCDDEGVSTSRHGVEALDEFFELYERALDSDPARAKSRRYSKPFLRDLMEGHGPGGAWLYLTAREGRLLAGGLLLRGAGQALAWIGCIDRTLAKYQGNVHRHCTVMRDLIDSGVHSYNLGAAPGLPDVARFKRRLGAAPHPYYTITWRNPLLTILRTILGRRS